MKKMRITVGLGILSVAGLIFMAADHIDAPNVVVSGLEGTTSDITDVYAFQAADPNSIVLVANVKGILSPTATADAKFDENVLVEFNIDTDGDNVEDVIMQAIPRDGKMYFFGPTAASNTSSTSSTVSTSATKNSVAITAYGESAVVGTSGSYKFFAGPRDDPFFFDFFQYNAVIAGDTTAFKANGSDTFAGTNVMSFVVEMPKSVVGTTGNINVWVESKRKQ